MRLISFCSSAIAAASALTASQPVTPQVGSIGLVGGSRSPPLQLVATSVATRVRASHILVQSEDLAMLCVEQLSGGAVFEELAETISMCDSKGRGGDLGWIFPGLMVDAFDEVAFRTEPGQLATVETEFGWHVLRVAERSCVEPEIEPLELRARLQGAGAADREAAAEQLQVIDIRSHEERSQASIPSSLIRHLPYEEWQTWAPLAIDGTLEPPMRKDVELIFMDHRGGRGERLMQYFAQNGFPLARFVRGGINAYAEEADPRLPTYLESDGDCLTCHEH